MQPPIGLFLYRNHHYMKYGLLIERQLAGIREAKKRGIAIKVNSILIPGVNDRHLKLVALAVKEAGAYMMNVIPLVPQAGFALLPPPD